jgi:hypothetical protein
VSRRCGGGLGYRPNQPSGISRGSALQRSPGTRFRRRIDLRGHPGPRAHRAPGNPRQYLFSLGSLLSFTSLLPGRATRTREPAKIGPPRRVGAHHAGPLAFHGRARLCTRTRRPRSRAGP